MAIAQNHEEIRAKIDAAIEEGKKELFDLVRKREEEMYEETIISFFEMAFPLRADDESPRDFLRQLLAASQRQMDNAFDKVLKNPHLLANDLELLEHKYIKAGGIATETMLIMLCRPSALYSSTKVSDWEAFVETFRTALRDQQKLYADQEVKKAEKELEAIAKDMLEKTTADAAEMGQVPKDLTVKFVSPEEFDQVMRENGEEIHIISPDVRSILDSLRKH